ncbi:ATP-dependent DNA helicase [Rurimicrobium arvi]|uniref:DNA 3'-5' helicase n=1 Tax=Rurimicrobium arvi TaxID=2049916 RepID=A0ABP8MEI5_9BACT
MNMYEENYQERFKKLNERQQEAVTTLDGPVMVLAGPGTGKTEVLGMRIANLLRSEAQVNPQEILCLTYTEEAAYNMRKRLTSIVGAAAQKVNIFTFHGFCNSVIQAHPEEFGYRQMEVVSDLEKNEILRGLLSGLPYGHPMHRIGNSTFMDAVPLSKFFEDMKRENWSSDRIREEIESYLGMLPDDERYIYKRNSGPYKKGDVKQKALDEEKARMQKAEAAAALYDEYNRRLAAAGRYDFADMILWVIDAFRKNTWLLQQYQERFQYILVDEFQDTNGAQNEILNLLLDYWGPEANIFVVGDDDQSIYEFQGARIRNILDFYEKYPTARIIVLTENYRSGQPILDLAMRSILNNEERLINKLNDWKAAGFTLTKDIVAAHPRFRSEEVPQPDVTVYAHIFEEEVMTVERIEALGKSGVPLEEIAVLFAKNRQADNIVALLERKQIPFSIKQGVNVLDEMIPRQVLRIFDYLVHELRKPFSGEHLLFELLHAPYFGIAPFDLARLSLYLAGKEARELNIRHWRQLFSHSMILSTLDLQTLPQILNASAHLDNWIQNMQTLRLPMLVEKIAYDSGMVRWCLAGEQPAWHMQVLNTFFDFVKQNVSVQSTVASFLETIRQMREEKISLRLQRVIRQEKGVQLFTAHSAKGLEFEHVFLIGATSDNWEARKGAGMEYKLPETLTRTNDDQDKQYKVEVARRLFFVAVTRAKKFLHLSYAAAKNDGKPLQQSLFITEILGDLPVQHFTADNETLIQDMASMMNPLQGGVLKLIDRQLMARQLEHFSLSVSAMNKYLRCPVAFYYEQVLCVPSAENDSLAFGTAIHYALERLFIEMQKSPDKQFPPIQDVLNYFRYKMRERELAFTPLQFERRMVHGEEVLRQYYEDRHEQWHKDVMLEKWMQGNVGAAPIKGKIDKIELFEGNTCRVVDYKTGKWRKESKDYLSPPSELQPKGGDYWRQMVFYKLLVESQPYNKLNVTEGSFEYVEQIAEGKYDYKLPVFETDTTLVRQQIEDVYARIKNLEFETGCGEEDCVWCKFAHDYGMKVPRPEPNEDQ